jgi:SAM-dependent methyltransferase
MRGEAALDLLLSRHRFSTVVDLGAGGGEAAARFAAAGKSVTAVDLGRSSYFRAGHLPALPTRGVEVVLADFMQPFERSRHRFDLVWASHVLEHQGNPQAALARMRSLLAPGGVLAVTVPPMKPEVVGGHLTLWTPGLLAYHLIHAGFDCAGASFYAAGYDISAIVSEAERVPAEALSGLALDSGDVDLLAPYFPRAWKVREGFHGGAVPAAGWA